MDNNSPITQVQRPSDNLNHSSTSLISQNSLNNFPNKSVKGNKLKKKGIFSSILCCFIPKVGNNDDDGASNNQQKNNQKLNNKQELTHVNGSATGQEYLLGPMLSKHIGKKTLVLDLDETLVHSSFKPVQNADFIVPVEIEGEVHQVYVVKRPGVDEFLKAVGDKFEIVVFTASLAKYADPVLNFLDIYHVVHYRLFRESCHNHKGNYVKDLSRIGRDLKSTIIVDNSPSSYMFHPENAFPIDSWFDDENDRELLTLLPLLDVMTKVDDVRLVLDDHKSEKKQKF